MTTVAVTDYASLSTSINDFAERSYDSGSLDRIIGLAESAIRIYLGPLFAKDASATVSFTNGTGALPAGFIRPIALTHATIGGIDFSSIGVIRQLRINGGTTPARAAIQGSNIEVGPSYTGNLTLDYEGSLTGLSGSNPTNWLVTTSPHAYLQACLAVEKLFTQDYGNYAGMQAAVMKVLDDLDLQAIVGQYGKAAATISGSTP